MKTMNKVISYCLIGAFIIAMQGCVPDELKTDKLVIEETSPEYAVPLINSNLSLDQLLNTSSTSFIRKAPDGFISIVYRGKFFSATASDLVSLPNQDFNFSIPVSAANALALNNGQKQTISLPQNFTFNISSREIDSVWLKAGTLAAGISSNLKTDGNLKIIFEDALKLGKPLTVEIPFTYSGNLPITASNVAALVGHHWDMSNGVPAYNNINIRFELSLNPTSNPISAGDKIDINFGLSQMKFSRFYGYIGNYNMAANEDSIDLTIFDNSASGNFTIADAIIKIISANSFGVPVNAGFSKLQSYSPSSGISNITGMPDPLPVKTPSINQVGQSLKDSFTINNSNSNIVSVINNKPHKIIFKPYVNLNPSGKQQRNFVTDDSRIEFIVDVELPLNGTAKNFVMESDNPVEVEMPESDLVESITLRFTTINGFPIDLATQVYLVDSFNQVFDSIFPSRNFRILQSASVGSDGKVTSSSKVSEDIVFDMLRAKRLTRLKKMQLRAELGTLNNGSTDVKIYSNYLLNISIGMKAKLKLNIKP